jgi:RAB protein geranylgeranyltransferase component A
MDDSAIKDVFDVIVLGTGLKECIVAAALAKEGKKVLHLDVADFYGSQDASFTLSQLREMAQARLDDPGNDAATCADSVADKSEVALPGVGLGEQRLSLGNPAKRWPLLFHRPKAGKDAESGEQDNSLPADLSSIARYFTIDLFPCAVFARGAVTDALVDSGVASYLEFKCLDRCFFADAGTERAAVEYRLLKVPASKADVFDSAELGLLEKRALFRFLQFAFDQLHAEADAAGEPGAGEEVGGDDALSAGRPGAGEGADPSGSAGASLARLNESVLGTSRSLLRPQNKKAAPDFNGYCSAGWKQRPFTAFLAHCGLSDRLSRTLLNAVALAPDQIAADALTAEDGMARVCRYLDALSRFGGSAFITPMYGMGELPQAFSRSCAVNGGIYILRADAVAAVVADPRKEILDYGALRDAAEKAAELEKEKQRREEAGEPAGAAEDATATASAPSAVPSVCMPAPTADLPLRAIVGIAAADGTVYRGRSFLSASSYVPPSLLAPLAATITVRVVACLTGITDRLLRPSMTFRRDPTVAATGESASEPHLLHAVIAPHSSASLPSPPAAHLYQQGTSNGTVASNASRVWSKEHADRPLPNIVSLWCAEEVTVPITDGVSIIDVMTSYKTPSLLAKRRAFADYLSSLSSIFFQTTSTDQMDSSLGKPNLLWSTCYSFADAVNATATSGDFCTNWSVLPCTLGPMQPSADVDVANAAHKAVWSNLKRYYDISHPMATSATPVPAMFAYSAIEAKAEAEKSATAMAEKTGEEYVSSENVDVPAMEATADLVMHSASAEPSFAVDVESSSGGFIPFAETGMHAAVDDNIDIDAAFALLNGLD